MDDATRILDAGTADYPLDADLSTSAEPCPNCTTTIAPGNAFCPSCGFQRGTWGNSPSAQTADPATEADRGPALYELTDSAGNNYQLPEGSTVLGRGEVDLQITDGYLSRRHASFVATPDSLTLTDLGSANGSFVGDIKLDRDVSHDLLDGQQITLGKLVLTVARLATANAEKADTADIANPVSDSDADDSPDDAVDSLLESPAEEAADTTAAQPSGWLLENPVHGTLDLSLGETTLGRSASKSDVAVGGDGYISGQHGLLVATDSGLSYMDLGSTNGSMLNDVAVAANEEVTLAAGDRLQLGQTEFIVRLAAEDQEQPAD